MTGAISVADYLKNLRPGDQRSMDSLVPLVYDELRLIAARQLAKGGDAGRAHTLQPTALVHEAFLKMMGSDRSADGVGGWSGRDHFMAVAAKAMRQVLVDHARRKTADKRGGGMRRTHVTMDGLGGDVDQSSREVQVLELDDLLNELARSSQRPAQVAEMRLFGGMEQEQIANVLGVTRMTVHRDWQIARAWLAAKVQDAGHD
jgi:RNA polymerase sigma factor (TIGR02999 family)